MLFCQLSIPRVAIVQCKAIFPTQGRAEYSGWSRASSQLSPGWDSSSGSMLPDSTTERAQEAKVSLSNWQWDDDSFPSRQLPTSRLRALENYSRKRQSHRWSMANRRWVSCDISMYWLRKVFTWPWACDWMPIGEKDVGEAAALSTGRRWRRNLAFAL